MAIFDRILPSSSSVVPNLQVGVPAVHPLLLPNMAWISTPAPPSIRGQTSTTPHLAITRPVGDSNSNDKMGGNTRRISSWHDPLFENVGNGYGVLYHATSTSTSTSISTSSSSSSSSSALFSSPLDDFFGNIFGNGDNDAEKNDNDSNSNDSNIANNGDKINVEGNNEDATIPGDEDDTMDDEFSLSSFQKELDKRQGQKTGSNNQGSETPPSSTTTNVQREQAGAATVESRGVVEEDDDEFTGYDLRDIIFSKYGECFDVEFQRVDSYGFRSVYLNILPFRLGGRKFRHETEYDYLCHLQAVVEILVKYDQLDYVMAQLFETNKKPRAGTSPLVAVPLRLDLTPEQVDKILG
ncbi:hypothetical protein ACHAXS_000886 [Conticribra weissflogii]